ncbi:MAG: hypothetical protein MZV63_65175 [Marinilabiliales bacterium]|nr:hypothetical protein [Marinilabiliales bacterium]
MQALARMCPGQAPPYDEAQPAAHPQGDRRRGPPRKLCREVATGLGDDMGRQALLAELPGDVEDLALALAPFAAGVDEEEAHRAIITSGFTIFAQADVPRLRGSSRSPWRWRPRRCCSRPGPASPSDRALARASW